MSIGTAAVMAVKKVLLDVFTQPEKMLKFVLLFLFLPLFVFILFFSLPGIIGVSLPSILVGGGNSTHEEIAKQLEYIAIYQKAPTIISQRNLDWINQTKLRYTSSNDIIVKYDYTLSWQSVISIDTVRLNQDFKNVKESDVIDLAEKFVTRDVNTEYFSSTDNYFADKIDPITQLPIKDSITGINQTEIKTRVVKKTRTYITISTKPLEAVLKQLNFDESQTNTALNMYNTLMSADVEGNFNIYDDDLSNLKEYPSGSATIPYFNQADIRWGNLSYGTSSIKSGGCGPTSLAMVVVGLTKRSDINPKTLADWSVANGYRAEGEGSYWGLMTAGGAYYGLKVEAVSRMNPNRILQALSQGHPVIVAMGRGHFTKGGHFIVLYGLTKDGQVLVNDPASINRTNQSWDISIIMNESSTNGGINGSAFWIFTN